MSTRKAYQQLLCSCNEEARNKDMRTGVFVRFPALMRVRGTSVHSASNPPARLRTSTLAYIQLISDRSPPLALANLFFAPSFAASPPFPERLCPIFKHNTDFPTLTYHFIHVHFVQALTLVCTRSLKIIIGIVCTVTRTRIHASSSLRVHAPHTFNKDLESFLHITHRPTPTTSHLRCSPASSPAPPAPSSATTHLPPRAALPASSRWPDKSRSQVRTVLCTSTCISLDIYTDNFRRPRSLCACYVGRLRRADVHCVEQDGWTQG
jgi:hypothetical protein